MEARGKAGQEMSLAALRLTDPYIRGIVDLTSQVALYSYCPSTSQWEKTDVEGTLFVYTRSASPSHGFTIMNRLNMNNLVEPVNKDLEFQLHEPFLLYRNSSLSIYSIWFYDKSDCQRISKLMAEVVRQESERAKSTKSPNAASDRPIDILEMLSKAKNEYEKGHVVHDVSVSSGAQPDARLTKADSLETPESRSSSQEKPVQKHLTVEELFGTSLPKEEPPLPAYPETGETGGHGLFLPFSCDQSKPPVMPESLIFGSSAGDYGHAACTAPVLIPQAAASQPDRQKMATFPASPTPAPSDALSKSAPLGSSTCMMHTMGPAGRQPSPLMGQPVSSLGDASRNHQLLPAVVAAGLGKMPGIPHPDGDLLHKLKLTPQGEQTQSPPISKANIAPKFPGTISQLATPESFKGSSVKTTPADGILPVPSQVLQFVAPTTTAASSLLLSPRVFEQSAQKLPSQEVKAKTSSPAVGDMQRPNAPSFALSRSQLQETLVHLIKNDSGFLSTVHEVYLHSLAKSFDNMKL